MKYINMDSSGATDFIKTIGNSSRARSRPAGEIAGEGRPPGTGSRLAAPDGDGSRTSTGQAALKDELRRWHEPPRWLIYRPAAHLATLLLALGLASRSDQPLRGGFALVAASQWLSLYTLSHPARSTGFPSLFHPRDDDRLLP